MVVFALIGLIFLQDGPHKAMELYTTEAACKAAQVALIADLIKGNIQEGAVKCVPVEVRKFA